MTTNDTLAAIAAGTATPTSVPASVAAPACGAPELTDPSDIVPPPRQAIAMHAQTIEEQNVSTWITKEAGNRKIPFEPERLERAIDQIHAEFPQLDVADYKRSVFGFVERKDSVNADDLVDHLIREAEARVDLTTPEWGTLRGAPVPAPPVQACQPQPLLRRQPEVRLVRRPAGEPGRPQCLFQRHPAPLLQGRADRSRQDDRARARQTVRL